MISLEGLALTLQTGPPHTLAGYILRMFAYYVPRWFNS